MHKYAAESGFVYPEHVSCLQQRRNARHTLLMSGGKGKLVASETWLAECVVPIILSRKCKKIGTIHYILHSQETRFHNLMARARTRTSHNVHFKAQRDSYLSIIREPINSMPNGDCVTLLVCCDGAPSKQCTAATVTPKPRLNVMHMCTDGSSAVSIQSMIKA